MGDCEHNFVHLDTDYIRTSRNYGNNSYRRIDRFYYTKCLEEKVKEKYECESYVPDWFNYGENRVIRD